MSRHKSQSRSPGYHRTVPNEFTRFKKNLGQNLLSNLDEQQKTFTNSHWHERDQKRQTNQDRQARDLRDLIFVETKDKWPLIQLTLQRST